jgi:hypothetical protein
MGLSFTNVDGFATTFMLMSESRGTHGHILPSQIRDSPKLEGQVPVLIYPRNRVARLYPHALFPFRRLLQVAGLRWIYICSVCVCVRACVRVAFCLYNFGAEGRDNTASNSCPRRFYAVRVVSKDNTWLVLPRGARQRSRVTQDLKPRMTVLARSSSNSPDLIDRELSR